MKLLLDTHVLLWWLSDDSSISPEATAAIAAPDNIVMVSAVSVWEIAIKRGVGKLTLPDEWYEALCEEPFRRLPITWAHAKRVSTLPSIHRDPFDRLLIAQALEDDLTLVTHDEVVQQYDVATVRA